MRWPRLLLLLFCLGLFSCQKPDQGPQEPVWGRQVGQSSGMALSDPRYAVQFVGKDGRPVYFVEIGGLVDWMQKAPRGEGQIWTKDFQTQKWIDARQAPWVFGKEDTPLGLGYAATLAPQGEVLTFDQVVKRIQQGDSLLSKHKARFK